MTSIVNKSTVLTQFKFYCLLVLSFGISAFFSSCYKEHREKPIQPAPNPQSHSELIGVSSFFSDQIDSNLNKKYISFLVNATATFMYPGYVRYKILSNYPEKLLYTSELLLIPDDKVLSIQQRIISDTIFSSLPQSNVFNTCSFSIIFENADGTRMYSRGYQPAPLGELVLERKWADKRISLTIKEVVPQNGLDANKNGYYQPFTSLSFGLEGVIRPLRCYYVLSYMYYSGGWSQEIIYGKSEPFDINGTTARYSPQLQLEPVQEMFGYRELSMKIYDASSDSLILIGDTKFGYNFELPDSDTRTYLIKSIDISPKNDRNQNGYYSSQVLQLTVESSDLSKQSMSIAVSFKKQGGQVFTNSYYAIQTDRPQEVVMYSDEYVSNGMYDLEISISVGTVKIGTYTKADYPALGNLRFETVSQDTP